MKKASELPDGSQNSSNEDDSPVSNNDEELEKNKLLYESCKEM